MSYNPDTTDKAEVHGVWVRKALGVALTAVFKDMEADAAACKALIDNGWTEGDTTFSGGSHAQGYAVDFDHVDRLAVPVVRSLLLALRKHGCEAVLRIKKDDVGAAVLIGSCHVHAALRWESNSRELAKVTVSGGRWNDVKQCQRLAAYKRAPW